MMGHPQWLHKNLRNIIIGGKASFYVFKINSNWHVPLYSISMNFILNAFISSKCWEKISCKISRKTEEFSYVDQSFKNSRLWNDIPDLSAGNIRSFCLGVQPDHWQLQPQEQPGHREGWAWASIQTQATGGQVHPDRVHTWEWWRLVGMSACKVTSYCSMRRGKYVYCKGKD